MLIDAKSNVFLDLKLSSPLWYHVDGIHTSYEIMMSSTCIVKRHLTANSSLDYHIYWMFI